MIALFTDFGIQDPYVGQLHAVLARHAPGIPAIDLFHHVPNYNVRAGAYLLAGYISAFSRETVFVCVVDPGVGSERRALFMRSGDFWFVGPDNGLFQIVARRDIHHECFTIDWTPDKLSHSFHGRDIFAPVAARLAQGERPESTPVELDPHQGADWPDDLAEIVYVDHFGNAISGYRAEALSHDARVEIGGSVVGHARTFSDAKKGKAFWYKNANGLLEFSVNQGSIADRQSLSVGSPFAIIS